MLYFVNRLFVLFFSVEGEDFTIMPPDVFEVIFSPGTVNGTTVCDPCSIINDTNLEGDHSFDVRIQGVAPNLMGITTDPQDTTVEITDDEGEWCSQSLVDWWAYQVIITTYACYVYFPLQVKL